MTNKFTKSLEKKLIRLAELETEYKLAQIELQLELIDRMLEKNKEAE